MVTLVVVQGVDLKVRLESGRLIEGDGLHQSRQEVMMVTGNSMATEVVGVLKVHFNKRNMRTC